MPVKFNHLLEQAGLDLSDVRLLRHQDGRTSSDSTPYLLWKRRYSDFMEYQSHQSLHNESRLGNAKYWAVFVFTPQRENLFVGLYEVHSKSRIEAGAVVLGAVEEDHAYYELSLSDQLTEYRKKLTIEWGKGAMSWIQRADQQDKIILKVWQDESEQEFPGYLKFIEPLSDVEALPDSWIARLKDVKGVYLLTCPKTCENYVGSATGEGGFYSRWLQHAAKGGDAVRFRTREPSELKVSILEVAGSTMSQKDIRDAEYRWIDKLKPALNGHVTLISAPKDA
jgi:hypothetical protein